jgi:hypothetical protein
MYAPFDLRFAAIIITRNQITLIGRIKDESIQGQVNASLWTDEGTHAEFDTLVRPLYHFADLPHSLSGCAGNDWTCVARAQEVNRFNVSLAMLDGAGFASAGSQLIAPNPYSCR